MKTTTFRLFATIITLAAITLITTTPAQSQRRETQRGTEKREAPKRDSRKEVKTKSATKTYRQSTPKRSQESVRSSRKASTNRNHADVRSGSRKINDSRAVNRGVKPKATSRDVSRSQQPATHSRSRTNNNSQRQRAYQARTANEGSKRVSSRSYSNTKRSEPAVSSGRRTTGNNTKETHRYYHVDRKDKRYTPNSSYRGSNKQWSSRNRSKAMNYNRQDRKFYSHYNYHKKRHWDRHWEHYRWNHHSWREYYGGYNPYSYRYHKYYYYNSHYGHVIRKFVYHPTVFMHNHNRYYCYDGHFFRYHRGVGYVLVNLPFGFTFERLPYGYEQVHINGYLYFRIGNLFFESSAYGFNLVHYPDRYYAYNDDYYYEPY